jgi:hypothetical protein
MGRTFYGYYILEKIYLTMCYLHIDLIQFSLGLENFIRKYIILKFSLFFNYKTRSDKEFCSGSADTCKFVFSVTVSLLSRP